MTPSRPVAPRATPRARRRALTITFLLLPLLIVPACGDDGLEPLIIGAVTIAPVGPTLAVGDTVQLAATVVSSTGSVISGHPVTWSSTHPGLLSVTDGGLAVALAPGAVEVRAESEGKVGYRSLSIVPGACQPTRVQGTVAAGQTVEGAIGASSCVMDWGRAQGWRLDLPTATGVRITFSAQDLPLAPVLTDLAMEPRLWSMWTPDGPILGGQLPAGSYIIWARAYGEDVSGPYQMTVEQIPICGAAAATAEVSLDGAMTGSIGDESCLFPWNLHLQPAQGVQLDVPAAGVLRVEASSVDFRPFIVLTDAAMSVLGLGWGDDGTALAATQVPAGRYIAWVMSIPVWDGASTSATGSFVLTARVSPACVAADAATPLAVDEVVAATLSADGCAFWHGGTARGYRLDLPEVTPLRLAVDAGFDPVVVVTDTLMTMLALGVGFDGDSAVIEQRFQAGAYLVWVTGFYPHHTGDFTLSITEVDIPLCPVVGDIALGGTVSGTLTPGDCRLQQHWYADPWRLTLSAQTTVRIDLSSSQFDTYLVLEDAAGAILDWDDDGGPGTNSRLIIDLPAGEYRVVATSYWGGETGAYQLAVQAVGGGGPPLAPRTSGGTDFWTKRPRR